jgi:methylmalonyl-CoA mutase cobalamin-binding domain/chain
MEDYFMKEAHIPIEAFKMALLQIDRIKAAEIFESCYDRNNVFDVLEHLTMGALEEIGRGWEEGDFSLSQVYMSGIICEELIEKYMTIHELVPQKQIKIAIVVLQDHHALGKRIVYSILRASGYDLIDFGQGLSVEEVVEKAMNHNIDVLLISTLMLPSALNVKKVVEALREKKSLIKIIVGGAPFRLDSNLWQRVKADADGKNGTEVTKLIEQLYEGGIQG